jgi:hypothetical protein
MSNTMEGLEIFYRETGPPGGSLWLQRERDSRWHFEEYSSSGVADISSEMLYPILATFLTQVLHASGSVVDVVEGIAEAHRMSFRAFRFGSRISSRKGRLWQQSATLCLCVRFGQASDGNCDGLARPIRRSFSGPLRGWLSLRSARCPHCVFRLR